jgi:hypothetical protein
MVKVTVFMVSETIVSSLVKVKKMVIAEFHLQRLQRGHQFVIIVIRHAVCIRGKTPCQAVVHGRDKADQPNPGLSEKSNQLPKPLQASLVKFKPAGLERLKNHLNLAAVGHVYNLRFGKLHESPISDVNHRLSVEACPCPCGG